MSLRSWGELRVKSWPSIDVCRRSRPADRQLTSSFAKLRRGRVATLKTSDLAVGIDRGVTAGSHRAHDLARVVGRAVADAALHRAVAILDSAPALLRTKHFRILIRRALPFPADDVSVRIPDAVGGHDLASCDQGDQTACYESSSLLHHRPSFGCCMPFSLSVMPGSIGRVLPLAAPLPPVPPSTDRRTPPAR